MTDYGFTEQEWKEILQILAEQTEVEKAVLFGSRAKNTFKPMSDVDIVVYGNELKYTHISSLISAFEDSNLPFMFDIISFANIKSDELLQHIQEYGKTIYLKGWRETTLGEVAEIIMGQSPSGDTCNEIGEGTPLLNGPTEIGETHPEPVQYTTDPRKISQVNDLLFCVRGSTTGRMNWSNQNYAIGRGIAAIRHRSGGDYKKYIRGIIDYKLVELLSVATGSTFPNVSKNQLELLQFTIPPLPEQKAIADVLTAFDNKIELLKEQNRTLEQTAQTIFKEWFGKYKVGDELPEGWRVGKLGDCINIVGEGTPKTKVAEFWGGLIPWFSAVDAPNEFDCFVIDAEKKITEKGLHSSSTRILRKGTTIITARGTVGKLAIAGKEMAMNQSCYGIVGKDNIGDYFVYYFVKEGLKALKNNVLGAVFDTITRATFDSIEAIIPPSKLITKFESVVAPHLEKVLANNIQIQSLTETRDALLPKLMSGEIRVKM